MVTHGLIQGTAGAVAFWPAEAAVAADEALLTAAILSTTAYAATLYAASRLGVFREEGAGTRWPYFLDLVRALIVLAVCAAGVAILLRLSLPAGFFETPLVPIRADVAILGAFFTSALLKQLSLRREGAIKATLVYGALFWVAPFYGFFSAPIFLAYLYVGSGSTLPEQRLFEVAAAMLVGEWAGAMAAKWLGAQGGRREGPP